MNKTTAAQEARLAERAGPSPERAHRLGALDVLLMSVWCGLAAGLLEVGARILPRSFDTIYRLYGVSRHFVWLVPLANLLLFSGIGVILAVATSRWPRSGGWVGPRFLCALMLLPMLMLAGPQIYAEAWFVFSLGIATTVVPYLERNPIRLRRRLMKTLPCLLGVVLILAGSVFGRGWIKQRREASRPLPPAAAPNVLLIVLDTVRPDHLSLYGYGRSTSPTLERMAKDGIRFDAARAAAPWTLASHASLFTGRLPHELGVKWLTPLGGNFLTLAEFLGSQGYATAGFVGNTLYCSYDSGLDRGFTHYEDFDLDRLGPLRTAELVDVGLEAIGAVVQRMGENFGAGPFRLLQESLLRRLRVADKKDAALINGEFLDWLSHRPQPARPFFAFLNEFDAHSPYLLPRGAEYSFPMQPRTDADQQFLRHWSEVDKARLPQYNRVLIGDCYDSCLAYLDRRLGELHDELQKRGLLENTLVIVTADHGEGLGEHGLYEHGESLYSTEIRVPLLFVLPARHRSRGVIRETISLCDLPATIADVAGLSASSSFPGLSLARFWQNPVRNQVSETREEAVSELETGNPADPNQGRSPAAHGPLISLAAGNFVYIRNQQDGSEELFDETADRQELINHAREHSMQSQIVRYRQRIHEIKGGSMRAEN